MNDETQKQGFLNKSVFEIEKNWITENFVLFSGACNDMKDYIERVDWDDFGTWYVYLYPSEIKAEKKCKKNSKIYKKHQKYKNNNT